MSKAPTFHSNCFMVEQCEPVEPRTAIYKAKECNLRHKELRSVRLGLSLIEASRALSISVDQAMDLEIGRLKCDWLLAAKLLKHYAEKLT